MPSSLDPIHDFESIAGSSKKWLLAVGVLLAMASIKPLRPLAVFTMVAGVILALLSGNNAAAALDWVANLFK